MDLSYLHGVIQSIGKIQGLVLDTLDCGKKRS